MYDKTAIKLEAVVADYIYLAMISSQSRTWPYKLAYNLCFVARVRIIIIIIISLFWKHRTRQCQKIQKNSM